MDGFIDMHCDSLSAGAIDGQLYDAPGHMLDIKGMVRARQGAQFFAVYFPPRVPDCETDSDMPRLPSDGEYFKRLRKLLLDTAEAHPYEVKMAYNAADIERNMRNNICSAVLTIEDLRAVEGDMPKLRGFYNAGVRAASLTWNYANCIGYPNSAEPDVMSMGLTEFGMEAVAEMNALGMLIDVSHLSDGGFWDTIRLTKKPVAATHSNSRELCGHPRNLSDEMIRALASRGGIAGLNFAPDFLTEKGVKSRIDDICRHARHFIEVGGEDCVGLGSDFDGINGEFEIAGPDDIEKLFTALKRCGITERQLEKLAYGNALRVIRDVM